MKRLDHRWVIAVGIPIWLIMACGGEPATVSPPTTPPEEPATTTTTAEPAERPRATPQEVTRAAATPPAASPEPTATATTRPAARAAQTPTPTATPALTYPTVRFREVTSEKLFDVHLNAGESVTEPGIYVLDVESGSVRGILDEQDLMSAPNSRFLTFRQFLPEEGRWGPVLYDQTSGRAFTWNDRSLHLVAGRGTNSGAWVVMRLGRYGPFFVALDGDLENARWFEIPTRGTSQAAGLASAWASPTDDHLLLYSDGAFHIVGLSDGDLVTVRAPGPLHSYGTSWSLAFGVTIFSTGDGFGLIGRGGDESCHVVRYDWTGTVLSDVTIRCAFDIETGAPWEGPHLSPDGMLVAANTLAQAFCECLGVFERFTATSVFDATSGEELFRIKGATWDPFGHGLTRYVQPPTLWLPDSSGLVVDTTGGRRVVEADGDWKDLPGALYGALTPSPAPPPLFLLDPTTVVDARGNVVATVSVELDSPVAEAPEGTFIAVHGRWGASNRDVLFSAFHFGPTSGTSLRPVLPPVVERPPFEEHIALRVAGQEECSDVRHEPLPDAPVAACLPKGSLIEAVEHGLEPGDKGDYWVSGPHTAYTGDCERESSCTWIHVRTEDGAEGWALSDHLRWAKGEPPPDSGG